MDLNRNRGSIRWQPVRGVLLPDWKPAHGSSKDAARLGNENRLRIGGRGVRASRATGRSQRPALMGKGRTSAWNTDSSEAGARLIDTIARNLKDETYRRDPRVWELRDDRGEELQSVVEPMLSTQTARPYFEVLVVSHSTQLSEEAQRRDRHAPSSGGRSFSV